MAWKLGSLFQSGKTAAPEAPPPDGWESLYGAALRALQACDPAGAVRGLDAALALRADHAESYYKRGNARLALGQCAEAVEDYDRAIGLRPDYAYAYCNRGVVLERLRRDEEALRSYEGAVALNPGDWLAWSNRGTVLQRLGRSAEALQSYDRALALQPDHAETHANRGNLLQALERHAEAISGFLRAIELKPVYAATYQALGVSQSALRQFEAAVGSFTRALELDPGCRFVRGMRLQALRQLCDWRELPGALEPVVAAIGRGEPACAPFALLALADAPALQRAAAAIWVREECAVEAALPAIVPGRRRERLRIGYFSPDLRVHAVADLMAGVFECHDRARFEVTAFAFGPDTRDAMSTRIEAAVEHSVDIRACTDRQAALTARERGIDIAIDLAGFTGHARFRIFGLRAAPLQVSYLGYPGTSGAACMDYLIADRALMPPGAEVHCAERLICLPWFQANDAKRVIASRVFTRAELGLPAQGFVFCCCNAPYKLSPDVFATWCRILGRVAGSCLLLYVDTDAAAANLRREAAAHGVDPQRLVFAGRLAPAEYLARYRVADLFLDTLPFNAGTTASDALWAGLPVLTCAGQSFAGRMAASLLHAIGLPELMTHTARDYEETAVRLAQDPAQMTGLRDRLARNRLTQPLFDTPAFTRNLETAYERIWQRHLDGLPPERVDIG
jgi:predicted O-linked N-acetylglucosamine transferase (SPINDLY family)